MEAASAPSIDHRIAARLKALRTERGWTLDGLAERSGVSRATLSRLENAEVSPTASALGRICSAFGLTLSRLMTMVEEDYAPLVRRADQEVWTDASVSFRRRLVSPPAEALSGEVLEAELGPGADIAYDAPPLFGLEHHIVLLHGALAVTVEETRFDLGPGDCLRYRTFGATRFETPADSGARYLLFLV